MRDDHNENSGYTGDGFDLSASPGSDTDSLNKAEPFDRYLSADPPEQNSVLQDHPDTQQQPFAPHGQPDASSQPIAPPQPFMVHTQPDVPQPFAPHTQPYVPAPPSAPQPQPFAATQPVTSQAQPYVAAQPFSQQTQLFPPPPSYQQQAQQPFAMKQPYAAPQQAAPQPQQAAPNAQPYMPQTQPYAAAQPVTPVKQPYPGAIREPYGERFNSPPANEWQEPSYSQMHDPVYNMYTPGIRTDLALQQKRRASVRNRKKPRNGSGRAVKFMRMACLIIICIALSGTAAYGVMEYRVRRGDFDTIINNQVVLGGSYNQNNGNRSPVSNPGGGMPAEDIYEAALNHVVRINTEFGGMEGYYSMQGSGAIVSGSGFIISSDGYILTNYHVIEIAHTKGFPLIVYLYDGTQYEAEVIGYDSNNDFAVIKIEAAGLNPAVIGDSDSIKVGQTVYAIGNPFGDLVYTMTSGIISALDRVVTVERKTINTIQFDAAVNRGNSGGPIYNTNGEVIGIVTAKDMRENVEGIGFAIPINDAIMVAADLIEHGYITGRPLMGVTVDTLNSGYADFFNVHVGAIVRSVTAGSAADKAGIEVGDIIIALADTPVESRETLIFALRRYKAGDTTTVTVWRDGDETELTITFDENMSAGQPQ